ncbi:hypothetical protein [Streptomyces sp. NPDC005525]|uniref:hypothetical protein n=1 Tax=Streptomyces sp. NPDC005525 TaxID=3364720 RepID=UPI0036A9EDD4
MPALEHHPIRSVSGGEELLQHVVEVVEGVILAADVEGVEHADARGGVSAEVDDEVVVLLFVLLE